MFKLFKSKKGIGIDDVLPLLFAVVVFVLILSIMHVYNVDKKKGIIVDVGSRLDETKAQRKLLDFLKIESEEKTFSYLISSYCNEEEPSDIDKMEIYLAAQKRLPITLTSKLVCSKNEGFAFRIPLCSSISSIQIPSFSWKINEILYCASLKPAEKALHPLLVERIVAPDGKVWLKRELSGWMYYQEENTENLLTVDKFDSRYADYKESEEYKQKVDRFLQDVKTKSEAIAPDRSQWRKVGNLWCMTITKNGALVNCEATMLSTEKLIETRGDVPVGTHLLE